MHYTQIVGVQECILRVVYDWDPDEELIGDIVSVDIEEGNIIPLLDEGIFEDIVEEVYNLHDDELADT